VTVGDVTIQVVSAADDARGHRIEATRFLPGGRLIVGAWQGPPTTGLWSPEDGSRSWSLPPLADPPDAEFLAALAADPAMLPG
jgi:hypothetical protein